MNAVKEAYKIINKCIWQDVDVKATMKLWFLNVLGYLMIEVIVTLVIIGVVTLAT